MYPYHNRIKQRIKNGELVGYEFCEDYPKIGECLVLKFSTLPALRPIRPHRIVEYVDILAEWSRNKEAKHGEQDGNILTGQGEDDD